MRAHNTAHRAGNVYSKTTIQHHTGLCSNLYNNCNTNSYSPKGKGAAKDGHSQCSATTAVSQLQYICIYSLHGSTSNSNDYSLSLVTWWRTRQLLISLTVCPNTGAIPGEHRGVRGTTDMDRKPTSKQYLTFSTVPECLPGLQLKYTTKLLSLPLLLTSRPVWAQGEDDVIRRRVLPKLIRAIDRPNAY